MTYDFLNPHDPDSSRCDCADCRTFRECIIVTHHPDKPHTLNITFNYTKYRKLMDERDQPWKKE